MREPIIARVALRGYCVVSRVDSECSRVDRWPRLVESQGLRVVIGPRNIYIHTLSPNTG